MFYRPHNRVVLDCGDQVMTKQSHKDECDIHRILKQYQRTGILTHIARGAPRFEDLPAAVDYQEALSVLDRAEDAFAALPASVRNEFRNDPAAFLAAFSDPTKADRLRELGLLNPSSLPSPHPLATTARPPASQEGA